MLRDVFSTMSHLLDQNNVFNLCQTKDEADGEIKQQF